MSIDKRLISTEAAVCTTDTLDVFGDSSCVALYGLNYDASDASGNYNGTPTNVTFNSPGYIDYAASFNGSTSGIATPLRTNNWVSDYNNRNVDFSYSLWFKNKTNDSNDRRLISLGTSSSPYQYVGIKQYQTELRFEWYVGGSTGGNVNTTMPVDDNWHHIVCVRESSYLKMYLDGTYIGQTQQTADTTLSTSIPLVIGANDSNLTSNFKGLLDQVRLFNKTLSASEVTKLYGEVSCEYTCTTETNGFPASASSNLVAYYKLDNDATDETGSHDGTASNVTFNAGRFGQAGNFTNSSSSRIQLSSAVLPADIFSVSLWINVSSLTDNKWILTQYIGGVTGRFVFSYNADGGLQISSVGNSLTSITAKPLTENTWYHIVLIKNGSSGWEIYVDGSSIGTWSNTDNIITSQNTVIGGNQNVTSQSIDGKLDQVRIFNKALSAAEVTTLYEDEHQCYITVDSTDPFGDNSSLALYQLENNANDSTGSYNGSASNVTYSTDSVIGTYSGSFNGSNSYVNIGDPAALRLLGSYSVSFWVNFDVDTGLRRIINKDNANDYSGGYAIYVNSRYFEVVHSTGSYNGFSVSNAFVTGEWNNFVVTFDSSNSSLKAYKNSVQVASTTTNGTLTNSGDNLYFGTFGSNSPSGQYLDGKLDQVRFFNKALDGSEIWKIYAEGVKG